VHHECGLFFRMVRGKFRSYTCGLRDHLRNEGNITNDEMDLKNMDGKIIHCLGSLRCVEKEGYIEGTLLDITHQKRSQELVLSDKILDLERFQRVTIGREKRIIELKEGLPLTSGCLLGDAPPPLVEIEENGTRLWVDILKGHKTGFYLDQRDNRMTASGLSKDKEVLDCFSYTGAFSAAALVHEAKHVTSVEASEDALALAQKNVRLNGVEGRWKGELANGFDLLKALSVSDQKFDMVILDPPSFTRRRDSVEKALSGYKEINLRAMKILRNGGFLVTSSCTNLVNPEMFLSAIDQAAKDARKRIRQVVFQAQSSDHPIIWGMENTNYLKFLIVEVCDR
jgi:23S rRNA G2069 N7-methylase RlmK/C1962 C5-methylase RlmI